MTPCAGWTRRGRANLDQMLAKLKARGIRCCLPACTPRNNGPEYVAAFDGMYPKLAEAAARPLYPFFLKGGGCSGGV